jgi:hypothetical protein
VRLFRDPKGFTLYAFGRMCRLNWGMGRFANGSRWFSGWHKARDEHGL